MAHLVGGGVKEAEQYNRRAGQQHKMPTTRGALQKDFQQSPWVWHEGPAFSGTICVHCSAPCRSIEIGCIGRSAIAGLFFSRLRTNSHWAHVTRVCRQHGERYAACNIIKHDRLGAWSVMVGEGNRDIIYLLIWSHNRNLLRPRSRCGRRFPKDTVQG